jgi:hypothetical protein
MTPPTKKAKRPSPSQSLDLRLMVEWQHQPIDSHMSMDCKGKYHVLLPASLRTTQIKHSLQAMQSLLEDHGFHTKLVLFPRLAISLYKESCKVVDADNSQRSSNILFQNGKSFLLAMLGMHPEQLELERIFRTSIRSLYNVREFLDRIRRLVAGNSNNTLGDRDTEVAKIVADSFQRIHHSTNVRCPDEDHHDHHDHDDGATNVVVTNEVTRLIQEICTADSRLRIDQLEREYVRIQNWNVTLSNALLQLFVGYHESCIQDVYYQPSPANPSYERITIYLYDPHGDAEPRPASRFTFLPALPTAIRDGSEGIVKNMVHSFWAHLLRLGYHATHDLRRTMSPCLDKYFQSGLAPDKQMPLSLKAHFKPPIHPLSFYLWGRAGSGKSKLVHTFPLALHATLVEHVDPELVVGFVKQTLNKPHTDLDLEFMPRSNNNDLSIMSVIQSRRMTMSQSKPGVVVLHMEEMPSFGLSDPNQLDVCRLISQRFSGRKSKFTEGKVPARNSNRGGVSNDTMVIVFFTSNYELREESSSALRELNMFSTLVPIEMKFLAGDARRDFALSYLRQCVHDPFEEPPRIISSLALEIMFGNGDTRYLVRLLRMLSFHVHALCKQRSDTLSILIQQQDLSYKIRVGLHSMELKIGMLGTLLPITPQVSGTRVGAILNDLKPSKHGDVLGQVLEYYFSKTLTPTVVVSQDNRQISALIQAVSRCKDVQSIRQVDVSECKMMKTMYDTTDTENLRDSIVRKGRGSFCAIELSCPNVDAQLCIREIIEDSPSMTAFSSSHSALYKAGLLFCVHVEGGITPEIRSRASLIL